MRRACSEVDHEEVVSRSKMLHVGSKYILHGVLRGGMRGMFSYRTCLSAGSVLSHDIFISIGHGVNYIN
ncbi:hypothetical protein ACN42_g8899 [Penicillium freii]|uniref:Uncharacterized protein n=1 Tax=Penicillium freii TaxID=48697 RepID=A0A101MD30_PENFR|nr:hypothetical protein ACN42_g8899 [Penicillium freii]